MINAVKVAWYYVTKPGEAHRHPRRSPRPLQDEGGHAKGTAGAGSEFPAWCVVTRDPSQPDLHSPAEWSVPPSTAQTPANGTNGYRSPLAALAALAGTGSSQSSARVSPLVAARLMAAVSFGYGVFQLCVSLLPPSLLKLIHFLGFEGDRQLGIAALMFARQGRDMRAPLASLALLWYHTIVRPFFALDGANVRAGVEAAQQLISEAQADFGQSALFLFFRGRVERLKSDVERALAAYEAAVARSPQREVQLLCLHEVGWCHLIRLDWPAARACFLQLRQRSRWSQAFYAYLAAVCCGAAGDMAEAAQQAGVVAGPPPQETGTSAAAGGGGGQLEQFIRRRSRRLTAAAADGADAAYCRLLAFELLFLWNALPSCSAQHTARLLEDCQSSAREPMLGLRHLVMGAAQSCLGRSAEAAACFRTCLERRTAAAAAAPHGSQLPDQHVGAFAQYELGVLLCRDPDTLLEGRTLLQRAQSDYKAYDFENRLNVRIHAALRQYSA